MIRTPGWMAGLALAISGLSACDPAPIDGPDGSTDLSGVATADMPGGRDLARADGAMSIDDMTTPPDLSPAPDLATDCPQNPFSTFNTVYFRYTGGKCRYTLAEARAGIRIPYELVVVTDVTGVIPDAQDAGKCGRPAPSGLIPFERLAGGGQTYCLCDTGLCAPPPKTPITLTGGVYPGEFAWDGLNWQGPSDTNNPKGAAFPAGKYDLVVSATGDYQRGGGTFPFVIRDTMTITLIP